MKKRIRVFWFLIISSCCYLFFYILNNAYKYEYLKDEYDVLYDELVVINEENDDMEKYVYDDTVLMFKIARDTYNYVYQGERLFYIIE